jgi:hypothetical protein
LLLDAIVLVYLNRQASSYIFRSRQYSARDSKNRSHSRPAKGFPLETSRKLPNHTEVEGNQKSQMM